MRGIEHLHPELQIIANKFLELCKAKGLNILITETFRSKEEQNALFAKGRTTAGSIVTNVKYPNSAHCWGVAFDFCRNIKGKEWDDSDGFFKQAAQVGKSLGLTWGGDWKGFVDKPHLEMAKFMPNSSTSSLIKQYGTPETFKQNWGNPTAAGFKPVYPTIKKGSSGEYVKILQAKLEGLEVDGIFGVATEAAVKKFQGTNSLFVDGIVGANTWGKLI